MDREEGRTCLSAVMSYCVVHKLCCPNRNCGFFDDDRTRPSVFSNGGYHRFEGGHIGRRTSPDTTSGLSWRIDGYQNDIRLAYGLRNLSGKEEVGLPGHSLEVRIYYVTVRVWCEHGCVG